ncbi:MAG TPA: GDYXXLXY domain-containing protein [Candidatus Paceibacterota bacterium]
MNTLFSKHAFIFIGLVVLQVVIIFGLYANRLQTLATGREVMLRTVPVDPRDLLRGEYVALRYEISSVSSYSAPSAKTLRPGDTVYVVLEEGHDGYWQAGDVLTAKPTDFSVFLRGKVLSANEPSRVGATPGNIQIEYGIEKYFVEAGKGRELERSGSLKVIIAVDRDGKAVIKRVEPIETVNPMVGGRTSPINMGRDTRRVADMGQLQLGLELYFDEKKEYPATLAVLAPTYISPIPLDPFGAQYGYSRTSTSTYEMWAFLEDPTNSALRTDVRPDNGSRYDCTEKGCFQSVQDNF